jgi:flagellar motor switch/type III secretory pathway protein FliN
MSDLNNPDLSVTIKFQVGETQVPLGELLNLNEGSTLSGEAVNTFFPKVRAVLGERTIAEGELVQIDGQVAVSYTHLRAHETLS